MILLLFLTVPPTISSSGHSIYLVANPVQPPVNSAPMSSFCKKKGGNYQSLEEHLHNYALQITSWVKQVLYSVMIQGGRSFPFLIHFTPRSWNHFLLSDPFCVGDVSTRKLTTKHSLSKFLLSWEFHSQLSRLSNSIEFLSSLHNLHRCKVSLHPSCWWPRLPYPSSTHVWLVSSTQLV